MTPKRSGKQCLECHPSSHRDHIILNFDLRQPQRFTRIFLILCKMCDSLQACFSSKSCFSKLQETQKYLFLRWKIYGPRTTESAPDFLPRDPFRWTNFVVWLILCLPFWWFISPYCAEFHPIAPLGPRELKTFPWRWSWINFTAIVTGLLVCQVTDGSLRCMI